MAATATPLTADIRERREHLGISRLTLAVRAGISTTWLAELEAGLRPRGEALARVEATLDELEAETQGFCHLDSTGC